MDIADMFGKIQKLQENMKQVREKMNEMTVEAESGGGMVKVLANANKRILKIKIDPEVQKDAEMMEDLICAAVNKALEKAEELGKDELGKATSGLMPNIPGLDMSKLGL